MQNKYESITYSDQDNKILDNTKLSKEDFLLIKDIKIRLKEKSFSSAIEAFYKFHKNNYSPSDIGEIFKVSSRQIQRIFKDMGINRDKVEAQQIVVSNRDYSETRKNYKKTILDGLTDTELTGPFLQQYIRHEIDLFLGEMLPKCEIIVGINSMNVYNNDNAIPIIVINNNSLYKYIIDVNDTVSNKLESGKNRDKSNDSKAHYKGYTLFRINTNVYLSSSDNPKIKYEKEVKDKLMEIVNLIATEVLNNNSSIRLE
ncbi:MAG: hypothetical protein H7Y18_04575 [Clostridiaceae bacterium]|nr:hypothetical protein [Clostridiaceae bacterium]